MPYIINATAMLDQPVYRETMEFPSASIRDSDWEKGLLDKQSALLSPGPILSVRKFRWWNLAQLAKLEGQVLSGENAKHLGTGSLYLLEIAFSFTPDVDNEVEWARVTLFIRPYKSLEKPIAIALYPFETVSPGNDNLRIALTTNIQFYFEQPLPDWSIAFIEMEAMSGIISGNMALDTAPNWDLSKYSHQPIRGIQSCYVIVKKPHRTQAVRATINVIAKVSTRHGLLVANAPGEDTSRLSQIVCTG